MRIINSIKGRIDGMINTHKSKYWVYTKYFEDNILLDDTVFFQSFSGTNFQGNPYYIYRHIFSDEKYKQYKLVIAHKNPSELEKYLRKQNLFDDRVKVVLFDSDDYIYFLCHSKYLVNNVSFNMSFIKKTQQVYLNTWHGTPLKTLGRSVGDDPFAFNNAQRNFLMCDYLIAPNKLTKRVYEEDHAVREIMKGDIVLSGYPRNSIFFDEESRKRVRENYSLENVTSVFYMPTWRGTACGVDDVDQVTEIEKLAKDLGSEYKVFVKFHPAMPKVKGAFEYCHNMPDDIEVYEFLNAVDILITDYSSVFFDYANTGKRIVLYQYDKEEYYNSRGVYSEVKDNLPFDTAYTYDELLEFIKNPEVTEYSRFIDNFCAYDSINANAQAVGLLFSDKSNKKATKPVDLYIIDFEVNDDYLNTLKEQLKDDNYRLVFLLGSGSYKYNGVKIWGQLDYMAIYDTDNLSPKEKLNELLCRVLCTKKAKENLYYYATREQRRIWGDMKIGHVYAKSKHLPIAVKYMAERWPEKLT
ncbi:MAG: CDP-glycerol glycerophosphotransferase family protein [Ruminococcus sp.]|nr:CDP-glycerol glycerophosphotransferase family protein [Ruminococcus sp.]